MSSIRVIAGLGNPGPSYARTRHNAGFMVLDALLGREARSSWQDRNGALVGNLVLANSERTLVKPLGFMNRSGPPIQALMQFHKWDAQSLVVVHDEIDLPFGVLRIKSGGGDGGHKGIRSIAEALGTPDFTRVRVGVGRPSLPQMEVAQWVLERFSAEEEKLLADILRQAGEALAVLCESGLKEAQNKFNAA